MDCSFCMRTSSGCKFVTISAFVLASASAAAWFVQLFLAPVSWPLGVGAFTVAATVSVVLAVLAANQTRPLRDAFRHYLEVLSQSDAHALCDGNETPMPRRLQRSSWRQVAGWPVSNT